MNELSEILISKIGIMNGFNDELDEILNAFEKLGSEEKENLPKFREKFEEKKIKSYLDDLERAVKNPIRFRRKKMLKGLEINVESMRDEVFDDDEIEETVNLLAELSKQKLLYNTLSKKLPSWIVQDSFKSTNERLGVIKAKSPILIENVGKVGGDSLKNYLIEQYIDGNVDILEIQDISDKIAKIDSTLNLTVNRGDYHIINDVYKLLEDVKKFGEIFNNPCKDLPEAKENLEDFLKKLESEFSQIKDELDYWHQLYEVYIPETEDINQLREKLKEIKNKCKENYKSILCVEELYRNHFYEGINLKEFVSKLEIVFTYFKDLNLGSKSDIGKVEEVYGFIVKLEKIWYEDIEELSKDISFAQSEVFIKKATDILEEYENLKREWKMYQKILKIEEEIPTKYPEFKIKVKEYKNKSVEHLGKDFENLIKFLRDESLELNVDKPTLENFIKLIKPLIKKELEL